MPGIPEKVGDDTLLRLSAAGDRAAFAKFVVRHRAGVFRYAKLLTNNGAEAEDVLQDAFLNAFRAADSYRGGASARSWMLTIARRALLRMRRKRVGEPSLLEPLANLAVEAGWGAPSANAPATAAMERRQQLSAALAILSPDDREVLLARDLEGLSAEETSKTLGLTVSAVKSRLHRARLRLAAAVRRQECGESATKRRGASDG